MILRKMLGWLYTRLKRDISVGFSVSPLILCCFFTSVFASKLIFDIFIKKCIYISNDNFMKNLIESYFSLTNFYIYINILNIISLKSCFHQDLVFFKILFSSKPSLFQSYFHQKLFQKVINSCKILS